MFEPLSGALCSELTVGRGDSVRKACKAQRDLHYAYAVSAPKNVP